jgi:hypothetical protein
MKTTAKCGKPVFSKNLNKTFYCLQPKGHWRTGSDWSMDIINHAKGFVPGNLRWATRGKQKSNQQYRTLGQLTDKEFKVEARRRGFKI